MLFEAMMINCDSLILYTYFFRKSLKVLLQERMSLDRRRLEEGLLLYWCLQRTQEYSLKKLDRLIIPAKIDELVQEVSPLYHQAFTKKWISK